MELFLIWLGIFFAGYMGALLKAVPFAEKELGTDSVTASYLVAAMGLAELVFRIPFGWAGDHPAVNRTYLLGGTFLMLGVFFGAFPMCQNFTMLLVMSSFSGIFQVKPVLSQHSQIHSIRAVLED